MTRRLTLAIVGTVLATLVMAGGGTLVLARLGARQQTEDDLRSQSADIAAEIKDASDQGALRVLTNLRRALNLEGVTIVRYGPGGRTVDALPDGVEESDLDLDTLRDGGTDSGNHGSLVYAATAAPVTVTRNTGSQANVLAVVVITRKDDPLLRPATGGFLPAALATRAIGALGAWRIGRRMTKPLRQVEEATRRIATGDLSTRLPAPDKGTGEELAALMQSINTMAEALERSRGVEQQFLLSVSHDLRTPLTSIRGYAEAITDGPLDDPAAGATVILSEARRLERLVRDLLDLGKLDARSFSFDLHPLDLVDVAEGTAVGFRPEADEAGLVIEVDAPPSAVVVHGDADRLAQVGANLVENSL